MECTHENRYDFGRQCSDCNERLGPEKVVEKTWQVKEIEVREEIAQRIEDRIEAMMPPITDLEEAVYHSLGWAAEVARGRL